MATSSLCDTSCVRRLAFAWRARCPLRLEAAGNGCSSFDTLLAGLVLYFTFQAVKRWIPKSFKHFINSGCHPSIKGEPAIFNLHHHNHLQVGDGIYPENGATQAGPEKGTLISNISRNLHNANAIAEPGTRIDPGQKVLVQAGDM